MKVSARDAYDRLFKYYGLRARDGYLSNVTGTPTSEPTPTDDSVLGDVYHFLYGDENANPEIDDICKKISEMPGGLEKSGEVICLTPYVNDIQVRNLPFNDASVTGFKEQGLSGDGGNRKKPCSEDDGQKRYTIQQLNEKFDENDNRIDVLQVFPCRGISELADTDVLTLFMSTINSVSMSRAVPYVNVLVSVQGGVDDPVSTSPFSFGNFLESGELLLKDPSQNARFKDQSLTNKANSQEKRKTQVVASMEIFTSPQTLVNASPDRIVYDENNNAGRHVDVFRPFLSIENLTLNVVPSGAGLISFKTANMKIRLFDRGNLSKIAPIVAPSRFGMVKFDIEYGWSHPAGEVVGRVPDAQDDRIGELIDSMRVTESYQVINSNFSFEQDGSVSVDLKLSMLGTQGLSNTSVNFGANDNDSEQIEFLLNEVQKLLSRAPKGINVPAVISGGADTFISMNSEDKKKLRTFANALVKGKKVDALTSSIGKAVSKLVGTSDKSDSALKNFQSSRKQQVQNFIDSLKRNDDPFIRTDGLCGFGVTKDELTGESNVNYASLGNIIVNAMGPVFQNVGDVVFIFNCFNKNAGAMYDHNIAQFPIKISSKNDKQVVLKTVLEKAMKNITKISPEQFMQIINENFILREASEAYGLSELYKDTPVFDKEGEIKDAYANNVKVDSEKPESQLQFEDKKIDNLTKIYGAGRNHPTFTVPRIAMKIDVKPSKKGENIVRVVIFDQAASNVGDIQEIFNDVTSNGFFEKEEFSSLGTKIRSARHGEVAKKVFEQLDKNKIIEPYTAAAGEPATLLEKLEKEAGNGTPVTFESGDAREILKAKLSRVYFLKEFKTGDTKLRNIFYKFFPTLVYGSMGSGIISAQLSSNQNDALTTISLQRQEGDPETPVGLPMLIHPTQLTMEVFGTPMFKYSQKFFVDFGTGTSADNFYVIGGVDMNFGPGEFKCSLKMIQLDVFGRFMKTRDTIYKTLISSYRKDEKKQKSN